MSANGNRDWSSDDDAAIMQAHGRMRGATCFSGIGAPEISMPHIDWIWHSEIEPFPCAVMAHRHPNNQNLGDILALDFIERAKALGPIDIMVGGPPCFPAGTMIASTRGLVPIEDVQVGDEVLTHEHRFRRVLRIGSKMAETVEVTGQGHHGFVTTANHPFLARQKMGQSTRVNGRAVRKTWVTDADWVAAEHMEGKHWACVSKWPEMPMPPIAVIGNETVPSLPVRDLMMIAGAYLGDGWIRSNERRGSVMFGLNPSKLDALRPAFDAYGKWHSSQERTSVRATICSRPLARWLAENFGTGAANKRVPMWALGHPERDALLQGYLMTDGGKVQFGHRATTISPDLALTMRMLAVSCGYSSSVGFSERPATHQIEGRTVNQSDTYTVTFGTSARSSFEDGGFRWQRVRSVAPTGRTERVYDLEVEEDHSYVADGICVHNCQAFSIAGLRGSLSDPRGNLSLRWVQVLHAIRPSIAITENVPGWLSTPDNAFGCFLAGIVGADAPLNSPLERGRWPNHGMVSGPLARAAWRVLDAQYVRTRSFPWAVPQRRRRVFVVISFGTSGIDPAALLFDRESLRGNPAPRREAGQGSAGDAGSRPAVRVPERVDAARRPAAKSAGSGDGGDRGALDRLRQLARTLVAGGAGLPAQEEGRGRVAPTLAARTRGGGGLGTDFDCDGGLVTAARMVAFGEYEDDGTASAMKARDYKDATDLVAHALRGEGFDGSEDGTGRRTPIVPVQHTREVAGALTANYGKQADSSDTGLGPNLVSHPIAIQERAVSENPDAGPDGKGRSDDGAAYTLEARQVSQAIAFTAKDHGGDAVEGISPTLRAGGHSGSHANAGVIPAFAFDMRGREGGAMPEGPHDTANIRAASGGSSRSYAASEAWGVRRLTPREAERLMGFPDDFTLIPWRGKDAENCPDGVRYKALGNSIAVNVISFIGERIEAVRAATET